MIGAHIFLVPDVVLPMRTPSRWPAVRTERSHCDIVPTECDGAYYKASARCPQRGLSKVIYVLASQRFFDSSLFSLYSHLHWHVEYGRVPSTEFCRRRQAVMCVNVIENINWQEGGAASLNVRDGDEKR